MVCVGLVAFNKIKTGVRGYETNQQTNTCESGESRHLWHLQNECSSFYFLILRTGFPLHVILSHHWSLRLSVLGIISLAAAYSNKRKG